MSLTKTQHSLREWTKQKWRTKSGKKSSETGERYLPEKAIKALSDEEYAATTRAKRKGTKKGKQFVKQPKRVAEKTRKYRRVGKKDGSILTYNQQYHKDTIDLGKVMINEKGQPVTVNVIGIEYNDKIYNVPSYNRKGGFYNEQEALKVFKKDIEKGLIKGYAKEFDGPKKNHPANIAARLEHQMMDIDGKTIPTEAIGFDLR